MTDTQSTYLLDNAADEAPERLQALAAMHDAHTQRHVLARGIGAGWHCLEIGAGNGSIAAWMADQVGETGRVVATDLDPRHLAQRNDRRIEVWRHDLTIDPLPEAAFDLIHVRLVLVHLRDWEAMLAKLVQALKPGGWLVDEEYDSDSMPPDPAIFSGESRPATCDAVARLMADHGFDRRFGRRQFARMGGAGLTDVGAEGRVEMLHHSAAGIALLRANWTQLREQVVIGGYVKRDAVQHDLDLLDAPDFMMPSSLLWTTWGRRTA